MWKYAFFVVILLTLNSVSYAKHRLYNGTSAELGMFPFVVGLKYGGSIISTGSIISPKHILMEAWNIGPMITKGPMASKIVVGCVDFATPDIHCVEYTIESEVSHPDFAGSKGVNDLRIITVVEPIELNENVQRITVCPDEGSARTQNIILAGGGPILQWLYVEVINCPDDDASGSGQKNTLCTIPPAFGDLGDSGSPLLDIANKCLLGFAVISNSTFDIHQKVSPYMDWIESVVLT